MDWKTCIRKRLAKGIHADDNLVRSLLKSYVKKFSTQQRLKLDSETSTSKITLAYDALRELLEALAVSKGYKIYNHECYASFLLEVLDESYLADRFDSLRKTRNSINYYGKDVSISESVVILEDIQNLIEKIRKKYF